MRSINATRSNNSTATTSRPGTSIATAALPPVSILQPVSSACFMAEGDFKETVKIAVLTGWDSDNPAATWGGLLGFIHGKDGIEKAFGRSFADRFNIHRTRGNFPNEGIDTFHAMAEKGLFVIDRVVQEEMGGGIDLINNQWLIPAAEN